MARFEGEKVIRVDGKPKAIFFDLDNTLLDHRRAAREALGIIFDKYGLEKLGVARGDFVEGYFRVNEALWLGLAPGEITVDRLRTERFGRLLEELGARGGPSEDELGHEYLRVYQERVYPLKGAGETLAVLSRHFPLGLATNGFADTQRAKLARTGWEKFFDWVVIAGEVGVFKPDPAFFLLLADLARADPGEVIYVGDSPAEDIVPARDAGLVAVWVRAPGVRDPGADYRVNQIADVLRVGPIARRIGERPNRG